MVKKYGKRITSVIVAFVMVFSLAVSPFCEAAGGSGSTVYASSSSSTVTWTGEDGVTYTFDTSTGTITAAKLPESMEVVIPSEIEGVAVEIIGDSAFARKTNLTSVVIPSSVTEIGYLAFGNCTNLTTAVFETSDEVVVDEDGNETVVHKGTTTMSDNTFLSDTALVSVTLPDTLTAIPENMVRDCTSLTSIEIPDSVTEIGLCAFSQCTSLTEVTIPGSVQSMSGAFNKCTGLVSVVLEDGIGSISDDCFYGCTSLETIEIPDSVTEIGTNAFRECSSLKSCVIPEGVTELNSTFCDCTALEEVSLPESLITIGEYAFYNCCSLTSDINLPNVTSIGDGAFECCSQITSVTFGDKLTSIGANAFDNAGLTSISIPDSVTSLGEYAFLNCCNAESISIGSGITSIPAFAFYSCSAATSLEICGEVTEIGDYAFAYCYEITEIVLPVAVETIGGYAFYHCNNLSEITIPELTVSIGDCAFSTCLEDSETGLRDVYVFSSDVEFGTDVFLDDLADLTIYGYTGSTAQTYAEENGHLFVDLESMYRDLSVTVCDSDGNVITDGYTITWYDEDGNAVFDSVWQVENVASATSYTVEIVLDDDMLEYYIQPDAVEFSASSEASVVVTLEDVNWFALTGQVLDADGNGLEEAAITVTHQLLGKQYTAVTDAAGSFSVNIPATSVTLKLQKDGYYSHTEYLDLADVTESSYDYGTYSLTAVSTDGLVLSVTLIEATEDGADADTTVLTSLARYNVSVTDESGNAVNGYEVQGSGVVFAENTVSAGQTLLVSIQDPSGEYQNSDEVSVTLDENRVGMASLSMTQKGGFTFTSLDGPAKCSMSVLDSNGTAVLSESVSIGTAYSGLDAGQYTILLMQQSNLIRNIASEDYLALLGLAEGTDYLKITLTVEDGVITALDGYEVPEFDESKITYTLSSSISTSKPSGMTVGAAFTVRAAYELDTAKSVDAVSVKVVFPEGVEPTSPQRALVNGTTTAYIYDAESRTATFSVSGEDSGVVTFYCTAGGTAGTYDLSIYLSLTGGVVQPLGTARADIQASSISVPEQTCTDTIIVSGITVPYANVTLYDNDTVVAETTSNAVGSWSTEMPLAEKLYTYSYHYVYAVIESDVFDGGTAMTEEELVIYDERSDIVVKKVTMYNFGHTQQVTEIDFTSDSTYEPNYNYNPSYPTFTFKAEIEMSDAARAVVENMYVYTVDQYGDRTYVSLTYDEETGLWVGSYEYTAYTKPAAVGVGYDLDDSYYTIPVDEEWLEDLEESYIEYYNATWDYLTNVYEEQFEEICDEDTGVVSVYYVDPTTQERTLAYTYMHYYAELDEDATAEYFEEIGFIALDEEENYWIYVEEDETEENLTGYITCTVNLAASECHVMSYNYSNLYEEESSVVVYSTDSVNAADSLTLTSDKNVTLLLSASMNDEQSSKYPLPERLTDKMSFKIGYGLVGEVNTLGGIYVNGLNGFQKVLERTGTGLGLSSKTALVASGAFAVLNQALAIGEFNDLQNDLNARAGILAQLVSDTREMIVAKCENKHDKLPSSSRIEAIVMLNSVENKISEIKMDASYLAAEMVNNAIGSVPVLGSVWSLSTTAVTLVTTGSFSSIFVQKMEQNYINYCNLCESLRKEILDIQEYIESNYSDCDEDKDKNPKNETTERKMNGQDDPSGYVYEAVPSNTVEGVTAVIYYKDEDGNAVVWDAEDYDQINYQVTDASGIYQWYVPTGEWKVVFTKDGYETTDTSTVDAANEDGWLPVPPPQIDIAVAIVSTEAPTVESVTAYTGQIEVVFSQYMDMESADVANVLNAITLTRDGEEVEVTVTAVDAEYNLEGTVQYATRFAVVPADGDISGELILTIDGEAENYAGTPLGESYVSEALTVIEQPTAITTPDAVEAVIHEETTFTVELVPCIADKTLTVETLTSGIVSVVEASVVTNEDGTATITITGELPGTGYIVVTEPISGISKTIAVNVVLESSGEDEEVVQPVTAYLEDGTVLTTGMTIPAGSLVTLMTETEGATIRYTVNDTCPCKEAALYYTGPIEITEDTVLRAAAVLDGVYSSTIRLELTVAETETPEETETTEGETETTPEDETETTEGETETMPEDETETTGDGTGTTGGETETTAGGETETTPEDETETTGDDTETTGGETETTTEGETETTAADGTETTVKEEETTTSVAETTASSDEEESTAGTTQTGDNGTASSGSGTSETPETSDVFWLPYLLIMALALAGIALTAQKSKDM